MSKQREVLSTLSLEEAQKIVTEQVGPNITVFGFINYFVETGCEEIVGEYIGLLPYDCVKTHCADLLANNEADLRTPAPLETLWSGKRLIYYLYLPDSMHLPCTIDSAGESAVLVRKVALKKLFLPQASRQRIALESPLLLSQLKA